MLQKILTATQNKTAVVYIDSYENSVLVGRIYCPYASAEVSFKSAVEFLKGADLLLHEITFPQSFSTTRTFKRSREMQLREVKSPPVARGSVATFTLCILYRQNSTWQGTVTWLEGDSVKNFRSVLELLQLIDSALS